MGRFKTTEERVNKKLKGYVKVQTKKRIQKAKKDVASADSK